MKNWTALSNTKDALLATLSLLIHGKYWTLSTKKKNANTFSYYQEYYLTTSKTIRSNLQIKLPWQSFFYHSITVVSYEYALHHIPSCYMSIFLLNFIYIIVWIRKPIRILVPLSLSLWKLSKRIKSKPLNLGLVKRWTKFFLGTPPMCIGTMDRDPI